MNLVVLLAYHVVGVSVGKTHIILPLWAVHTTHRPPIKSFVYLCKEISGHMKNERQNTVELLGTYGGDITHALSAWTSTSRELTDEKRGRVTTLLKQLAENKHGSVFEKSFIHFLVKCDTVTHYQLLKHRIGVSINTESARYKELKDDKFYIPADWSDEEVRVYTEHCVSSYEKYHKMIESLVQKGYTRKRAKESARFLLPLGNQLILDISFNFRSFIHFLSLRLKDDAQLEIRYIASEMLRLLKEKDEFRGSLEAFGYLDPIKYYIYEYADFYKT